jgi:nucleoside-diphosphate-sugar epimerase
VRHAEILSDALIAVDQRIAQSSHVVERLCYRLVICRGQLGASTQGEHVKVFVTGGTGVLGRAAVTALVRDGHDVTGLARSDDKAAQLAAMGAGAASGSIFDRDDLACVFDGFDAVCNLATHFPVGMAGLRAGAWKLNDRLRVEGSRVVVQAARMAGVRRLVQVSVSFLYADAGEDWITEDSTLSVTRSLDPAAVAEANAAEFACKSRQPVVLRFGNIVGDDAATRWRLAQAKAGRPIGLGDPQGWAHVVHPEDAGSAVAAALDGPGGVYNVGAEPIRRIDMFGVFARAVGRDAIGFMPRIVVRVGGDRLAPMTRSLRVSSDRLHEATGWKPTHDVFSTSWLTAST